MEPGASSGGGDPANHEQTKQLISSLPPQGQIPISPSLRLVPTPPHSLPSSRLCSVSLRPLVCPPAHSPPSSVDPCSRARLRSVVSLSIAICLLIPRCCSLHHLASPRPLVHRRVGLARFMAAPRPRAALHVATRTRVGRAQWPHSPAGVVREYREPARDGRGCLPAMHPERGKIAVSGADAWCWGVIRAMAGRVLAVRCQRYGEKIR